MAQLEVQFQSDKGGGKHITFAPDPRRWVTIDSNKIHLWEGQDLQSSLPITTVNPGRPVFNDDGQQLCVGTEILNLESGQSQTEVAQKNLSTRLSSESLAYHVNAAVWSPDTSQVVVYAEYRAERRIDRNASQPDVASRLLLFSEPGGNWEASLMDSPERQEFHTIGISQAHIVAGGMWKLAVWDRSTYRLVAEQTVHSAKILDLAFDSGHDHALTSDWSGDVILWDTETWNPTEKWQAHEDGTHAVTFHPTQPLIMTGGGDGYVRVWDLSGKPTEIASLAMDGLPVGVAFYPTGTEFIAADDTGAMVRGVLDLG